MFGVSQRGMEQEMYDRMKKNRMIWWAGCILLAGLFTADLMTGSASVSPVEVCKELYAKYYDLISRSEVTKQLKNELE